MNRLKIIKGTILVVVVLLVAAQFVRPEKTNPPIQEEHRLETHVQLSPEISSLLNRACFDCHSNRTEWPWYSNIAPVSWFVIDHVNHGRRHLNFSEWGKYQKHERDELLGSIAKMVRMGEMPLDSYNLLHPEARLTGAERGDIQEWAQSERNRMAASVEVQY
jgi:hypothetical protein